MKVTKLRVNKTLVRLISFGEINNVEFNVLKLFDYLCAVFYIIVYYENKKYNILISIQ